MFALDDSNTCTEVGLWIKIESFEMLVGASSEEDCLHECASFWLQSCCREWEGLADKPVIYAIFSVLQLSDFRTFNNRMIKLKSSYTQ